MLPVSANRAASRAIAIRPLSRTLHSEVPPQESDPGKEQKKTPRRHVSKRKRGGWSWVFEDFKYGWRSRNVFISRLENKDTDEVKDKKPNDSPVSSEDVGELREQGLLLANALKL